VSDVQTTNMQMSDVQTSDMKTDLRGRAAPREVKFGATGKILGLVAVVVLVGAVGAYVRSTMPAPKPAAAQHVSLNQLPQLPPNPPAQQTQQQ